VFPVGKMAMSVEIEGCHIILYFIGGL
jgi:hypothetical protein